MEIAMPTDPSLQQQIEDYPLSRVMDGTRLGVSMMRAVEERQAFLTARMRGLKSRRDRKIVPGTQNERFLKTPRELMLCGAENGNLSFKIGVESGFVTATADGSLPESFPGVPRFELVVDAHLDPVTGLDVDQYLEFRPDGAQFLNTRYYSGNDRLGKIVTLPEVIGSKYGLPRVGFTGLPNNPAFKYYAEESTFLDAILYQAYIGRLVDILTLFKSC